MAKKKLYIPFRYYYDDMYDYVNYDYPDSNKIWWDIENNKQVTQPWKPMTPTRHFISEERYQAEMSAYPERVKQFEIDIQEWQTKVNDGAYTEIDQIVWKENFEFEDTLILTGMSRGRSAANFNWQSVDTQKDYNMFMTDIVDLIQNADITKGKVSGKWTFCKRGANFGIKLIEQIKESN